MSPSDGSTRRTVNVLALSSGPATILDLHRLEEIAATGCPVTWAALSPDAAEVPASVTLLELGRDPSRGPGRLRWRASSARRRLRLLVRGPSRLTKALQTTSIVVALDAPAADALGERSATSFPVWDRNGLSVLPAALGALVSFDPEDLRAFSDPAVPALALARLETAVRAGLGEWLPLPEIANTLPTLVRAKRATDVRRIAHGLHGLLPDHTGSLLAWSDLTADGVTALDVTAAARASLRAADKALEARDREELSEAQATRAAADHLYLALEVLFHRELHSDALESPLIEDADTFLEPLRGSRVGQLLTRPTGTSAGDHEENRADEEARTATVVTGPYGAFHHPVVTALRAAPATATHVVRPRDLGPGLDGMTLDVSALRALLALHCGRRTPRRSYQPMLAAVEGSDVVVADWAGRASALLSWYLPRPARLVLRVHSVDVLRPWLQVIDWSRVDTLVCVAGHIADLVRDLLGSRLETVKVQVLPPAIDHERMASAAVDLPKQQPIGRPASRSRTAVMVGWAQRVKDPLWALDVLARLRRHDLSWRLLLVGHDFPDRATASGGAYAAQFRDRAAAADVRDGVEYVPYTEDLPPVLARTGFALSTSRREAFPIGLREAVAAGCVPIVRDWPLFRRHGGARSLYGDWVVDTPEEAAERMLALADEPTRADAARRAADNLGNPGHVDAAWRGVVFGDYARLADLRDQGRHEQAVALVRQILNRGARSPRLLAQAERSAREAGESSLQFRACEALALATHDERYLASLRRQVGRMRETDARWRLTVSDAPDVPPDPVPGRVLHVLKVSLPERQSGYALRSHHVLGAQRDLGLDPVGVTALDFPRQEGATWVEADRQVEQVDAIDYHRLLRQPTPVNEPVDLYLRAWADRLLALASDLRPALIHAHSGHRGYEPALVGAAVADALRIPFVYEVRGFFEAMWTDDLERAEIAEAYRRRRETEERVMSAAAAVVTLSESMAEDLADRGVARERIYVVPNGVTAPEDAPADEVEQVRRDLGLTDAYVVGYISNLDHFREGQELLVEAAARLRAAGLPAVALIVGSGRRAEEVRRLARELDAEDAVRFTGRVPHDRVGLYYALCDVFVVPRVQERAARLVTPLKPYEAMARGIPLVVSDLPALTEIIGGGDRGWSFRAGDAASLTTTLQALHSADQAAVRARAERARRWVLAERSWAANVERYRRLYADLARRDDTAAAVDAGAPVATHDEWGLRYRSVLAQVDVRRQDAD